MPLGLPGPLGGAGGGGPPGAPPMGGPPTGGPPGGTGAAMVPQPMGASHGQGAVAVRNAIDALQKALPNLPMGSDLWSAVHKALGDIGKHMDMTGGKDPAAAIQQMMAMMRDAKIDPQRRAFMQSFPSPGGGGASPPGPPGIPPGAGGGAPPLGLPGA